MISRALLLAASLTAVACSSTGIDPSAGVGGRGGAGTGGIAGQGGTGGIPACVQTSANPGLYAYGEDDRQPRMSLTAPVTVVSVDACAPTVCAGIQIVVAEAGGRRWRLSAYFPNMPADIVSAGESLDLRIEYRPIPSPVGLGGMFEYWTTVLSRGGTAVMFDGDAQDLAAYGITAVRSASVVCQTYCPLYGADVTYGTETSAVAPNQTVSIGKLTVTHRYFVTQQLCFGDVPTPLASMTGLIAR